MNNPFLLADISFASHVPRKQWLIFGMLEQFTKQGCVLPCSTPACIALSHPAHLKGGSWTLSLHMLNPSAMSCLQ